MAKGKQQPPKKKAVKKSASKQMEIPTLEKSSDPIAAKKRYNDKYNSKKKAEKIREDKLREQKTNWARKKSAERDQQFLEQFNKKFEEQHGK